MVAGNGPRCSSARLLRHGLGSSRCQESDEATTGPPDITHGEAHGDGFPGPSFRFAPGADGFRRIGSGIRTAGCGSKGTGPVEALVPRALTEREENASAERRKGKLSLRAGTARRVVVAAGVVVPVTACRPVVPRRTGR